MQFKQECEAKRDLNKSVTLNNVENCNTKWPFFTIFCRYLFRKTHVKKKIELNETIGGIPDQTAKTNIYQTLQI